MLTKHVHFYVNPDSPEVLLDWNIENISHLARHRIQSPEVEEFFRNEPVIRGYEVVDGEQRWSAVGVTNALRVLVLVFTVRGERIRPITGWNADRRTKREYFAERGT